MIQKKTKLICVFVGGIFTPALQDIIESTSKGSIQYAADTLQKCYIEGLSGNNINFTIFNLPFVGGYPTYSSLRKISNRTEILHYSDQQLICQTIGFNNVIGYKNISRYCRLKKALIEWIESNEDGKLCIIVYSAHTPFMKACAEIKKKCPKVKIVLIVPDLPEFMSQKSSFVMDIMRNINVRIANELYSSFDGFVFLSEHMKDVIPVKQDCYRVIEGIISMTDLPSEKVENEYLDVVYSGTLAARYGIMNLVEAFSRIDNAKSRLIIMGAGDAEEDIKKYELKDKRIQFLGQKTRFEVLKIQSSAALLVNPRTSEGEFTKYSFPSKTMEYIASGVPTLINRLPGIPSEYYNYTFQPNDETIQALSKKITEILDMDKDDRQEFGNRAKKFILNQKGPKIQCIKLLELIESLF